MKKDPSKKQGNRESEYLHISDEELIERMHKFPQEYPAIMNHLIKRHTDLVKMIARKYCTSPSDMDDLIQEGMIGLYDSIGKYDPSKGSAFRTYAWMSVRSNILNAIESKNSNRNSIFKNYVLIDDIIPEADEGRFSHSISLSSTESTPEEQMIFEELREGFLNAAKENLSESERNCIMMKMSGASVKEIAQLEGMSEKAVEGALLRARKKLKGCF